MVCLVGLNWTAERASRRDCSRRDHRHVSVEDATRMVRDGTAEWLAPAVVKPRASRHSLNRLSIKFGETLALMVYRGSAIAALMLREIRRR